MVEIKKTENICQMWFKCDKGKKWANVEEQKKTFDFWVCSKLSYVISEQEILRYRKKLFGDDE